MEADHRRARRCRARAGPDRRATTSTITSPRTTTRLTRTARRDLRRQACVSQHQPHVRLEARPLGLARQVVEQERGHVLARHPSRSARPGPPPARGRGARVELLVLRQRVRHHHSALVGAELAPCRHDAGNLSRRVHPPRHRMARVGEVEAREAVRPVAEHRRRSSVSSRSSVAPTSRIDFTPRRPPRSRCASDVEVGRHVPRLGRAAVHAAEAARGEAGFPPGRRGVPWPRRWCRRSPARGERREVADPALHDVVALRDGRERRVARPDAGLAGHDRHRGRNRTGLAHRRLGPASDLEVPRPRQPMADDRALERHHRPASASASAT